MSHFSACVLVKKNGSSPERMAEEADALLSRFDINKETAPYKRRLEEEEIRRIAEHYGIDPADPREIAAKLESWNGDKGGVDEQGVYELSTKNPDGHIDSWSIAAEIGPEECERLLTGQSGEEESIKVVVTPDGRWLDGPWVYGKPNEEQAAALKEWDKKITSVLQENPDAAFFIADCHI